MGWYEDRFNPHPDRVECACKHCGRSFWLPPCEVSRRKTCGKECRLALGAQRKKDRARDCLHCGLNFTPRTTQVDVGQGKYCSIRCSTVGKGQLWTQSTRIKAAATLRMGYASGLYMRPSGENHVQWKGGPSATQERRRLSGKSAEQVRSYRKRNPEKVREFSKRRNGRKLGRLPKGTINRIGGLQRWKCAACREPLKKAYHVDHIVSLMAGGQHAASNLQLLCPTCNVRKWAKDPIDFMRERGFLL